MIGTVIAILLYHAIDFIAVYAAGVIELRYDLHECEIEWNVAAWSFDVLVFLLVRENFQGSNGMLLVQMLASPAWDRYTDQKAKIRVTFSYFSSSIRSPRIVRPSSSTEFLFVIDEDRSDCMVERDIAACSP